MGNYSLYIANYREILPFCQVYHKRKVQMTKKELAERIDVDPKTLRNWEATKPELMKLIYLGLATEQHIKDVEQYLQIIQETTGLNK
jgi:hypothetical protein